MGVGAFYSLQRPFSYRFFSVQLNPKQKRMSSKTGSDDVMSVVFLGASKSATRLFDNDLQRILILT